MNAAVKKNSTGVPIELPKVDLIVYPKHRDAIFLHIFSKTFSNEQGIAAPFRGDSRVGQKNKGLPLELTLGIILPTNEVAKVTDNK